MDHLAKNGDAAVLHLHPDPHRLEVVVREQTTLELAKDRYVGGAALEPLGGGKKSALRLPQLSLRALELPLAICDGLFEGVQFQVGVEHILAGFVELVGGASELGFRSLGAAGSNPHEGDDQQQLAPRDSS